jgi:hypothetical protein
VVRLVSAADDPRQQRLAPASEAIGLERSMEITVTPLHNFFGPRLDELPGLVSTLPGAPGR